MSVFRSGLCTGIGSRRARGPGGLQQHFRDLDLIPMGTAQRSRERPHGGLTRGRTDAAGSSGQSTSRQNGDDLAWSFLSLEQRRYEPDGPVEIGRQIKFPVGYGAIFDLLLR